MREMNDLARPHVRQVAYIYMDMLAGIALHASEVARRDPGVLASLKSPNQRPPTQPRELAGAGPEIVGDQLSLAPTPCDSASACASVGECTQ